MSENKKLMPTKPHRTVRNLCSKREGIFNVDEV